MEDRLIFQHLPKSGGTTFNSILKRIYGEENFITLNIDIDYDDFLKLPESKKVEKPIISGHIRFGIHKHLTKKFKYITFLRKPEERIISFYNHVKREKAFKIHKQVVENNMSLLDFATEFKRKDLNNGQIYFLSGIDDSEENMLEKALENIEKHFAFAGITERYTESLILLERLFNWPMPYSKALNRSNQTSSIDEETLKAIKELNAGDIKLYEAVNEKLTEQINNSKPMHWEKFKLHTLNKVYCNESLLKIARLVKPLFYSPQRLSK